MKKIILILLIGAGALSSCEKLLEQESQSSLDAGTAYTTKEGIEAGIIGIYSNFQSSTYYGTDYTLLADLEADNLVHTGSFPTYQEIKSREINPDNFNTTAIWAVIYQGINRANTVIDGAEELSDPVFDKNTAIAEASFLRAYMYFDLMRFFGGDPSGYASPTGQGVPLVLKPTFTVEDAVPVAKSTAKQVFDQINADLDFAIANLPGNNGTGRATVNAAIATKARVALYLDNFSTAEDLATQIIDQFSNATAYGGLAESYSSIYIDKNVKPESIFELQFSSTNASGLYFYYFGRYEVATSSSLRAAHEPGDLRLPVNYFENVGTSGTLKYSKADGTDNILLIRLAELYLIRAEARARKATPDIPGAAADINVVRDRAGLGPTTAATAADMLTAVLQERRIELAHEAHRWFDLRRTGLAASFFGISDARKVLWPVPQQEVLNSGGVIVQNPGY